MQRPNVMIIVVISSVASLASAQTVRDIVQTTPEGAAVARQVGSPTGRVLVDPGMRTGVLWTYNDPVSIPESVALGDHAADSHGWPTI